MGKGFFQFGKGVLLRGPCRLFFSHRKGVPGHGKGVPGPSMTNVIRALVEFEGYGDLGMKIEI